MLGPSRWAFSDWLGKPPLTSVQWGAGMVDLNPLYLADISGVWTASAVFDAVRFRTVFTDAGTNWIDGQLVERLINPDVTQPLQAAAIANTSTIMGQFRINRRFGKNIPGRRLPPHG